MAKAAPSSKLTGGMMVAAPEDDIKSAKNPKYPPKKSCPTGIDPAYPQKNFVRASFANKNKTDANNEEYYNYMYGIPGAKRRMEGRSESEKKPHNVHGYSAMQRVGRLRTSGSGKAHRIGKR